MGSIAASIQRADPAFLAYRVKVVRPPAEFIGIETMDVHFMPISPGEGG